jgi:AbrB family looped-hinge helix DNA binding protein
MPIAHSKLTAQAQISVPSEIRKKLGIGPGSVLEWDEQDGQVIVRRAARFDWNDVRKALFPQGPPRARTLEELNQARLDHIRRKHARD